MALSQNGYVANDGDLTTVWTIPGTDRTIRLKRGDAGWLLVHFAAWFDKHVEDIEAGQLDDWGYAERPIRGSSTTLSNHASGTAMDLNATRHPMGVRGTFTPAQAAAIRAQLRTYDGCIRWGGDYTGRPDEMHFEINRPPADVSALARRLRTAPEEDAMPAPRDWTDEDWKAFDQHVWHKRLGGNDGRTADLYLLWAANASRRNEARLGSLRKQAAAVRKAVDGNASPAEVKRLLDSLDATIKLVVNEQPEE